MATHTSIKNKYLTISDGDVLGVTTNTENVSLLSFKLATADSLSKFNMVDGFSDDYQDATGVDASASTDEVRDSTGKYYSGSVAGSITTLVTTNWYTTLTGTWTPTVSGDAEILLVAGGGGGAPPTGGLLPPPFFSFGLGRSFNKSSKPSSPSSSFFFFMGPVINLFICLIA